MRNERFALLSAARASGALIAGCGGSTKTVTQAATPAAASPAPVGPTVPHDIIGQRLDPVESELDSDNIAYKEIGGGTFGIVVKSNWVVCHTRAAPGQTVGGSGIALIVNHFNC